MATILSSEVVFMQSENPVDIKTARGVIVSPAHWMLVGGTCLADSWWQLCKRDQVSSHHLSDLVKEAMDDHPIEIVTLSSFHLPDLVKIWRDINIARILEVLTK